MFCEVPYSLFLCKYKASLLVRKIYARTFLAKRKGGLIATTKALVQELAPRKITVNTIAPRFVETDMVEGLDKASLKAQIPARRFGKPKEVAALVSFLASPNSAYITGQGISINGGLY